MAYQPYNAHGFHEKVPILWNFSHYSYRAHHAFFTDNWEGIITFGLSKKAWLNIWHWYTLQRPYYFGVRHIRMVLWKRRMNLN